MFFLNSGNLFHIGWKCKSACSSVGDLNIILGIFPLDSSLLGASFGVVISIFW